MQKLEQDTCQDPAKPHTLAGDERHLQSWYFAKLQGVLHFNLVDCCKSVVLTSSKALNGDAW